MRLQRHNGVKHIQALHLLVTVLQELQHRLFALHLRGQLGKLCGDQWQSGWDITGELLQLVAGLASLALHLHPLR